MIEVQIYEQTLCCLFYVGKEFKLKARAVLSMKWLQNAQTLLAFESQKSIQAIKSLDQAVESTRVEPRASVCEALTKVQAGTKQGKPLVPTSRALSPQNPTQVNHMYTTITIMTAEDSLPLNVLVDLKAKHNSLSYNDWEALNYPTLKPLIEDKETLETLRVFLGSFTVDIHIYGELRRCLFCVFDKDKMQERAVLSLKWLYLGNCLFKPQPSQRSSIASSVPMPIQSPTMVVQTSVAKSSQKPSSPTSQPQLSQEPHGQLTIMSKPNQIVV